MMFIAGLYVGVGLCYAARNAFYAVLGNDWSELLLSPIAVAVWPIAVVWNTYVAIITRNGEPE